MKGGHCHHLAKSIQIKATNNLFCITQGRIGHDVVFLPPPTSNLLLLLAGVLKFMSAVTRPASSWSLLYKEVSSTQPTTFYSNLYLAVHPYTQWPIEIMVRVLNIFLIYRARNVLKNNDLNVVCLFVVVFFFLLSLKKLFTCTSSSVFHFQIIYILYF